MERSFHVGRDDIFFISSVFPLSFQAKSMNLMGLASFVLCNLLVKRQLQFLLALFGLFVENSYLCSQINKRMKIFNLIKAHSDGIQMAELVRKDYHVTPSEQLIDALKELATKVKEVEIERMLLSHDEKEEEKRQWKLWCDAAIGGVKDGFSCCQRLDQTREYDGNC